MTPWCFQYEVGSSDITDLSENMEREEMISNSMSQSPKFWDTQLVADKSCSCELKPVVGKVPCWNTSCTVHRLTTCTTMLVSVCALPHGGGAAQKGL